MPKSDSGWLAPAFAIVAAVSLLRLALLEFNRTDLFVDEAQYWLWSQDFDFGYYSKPPLIAWVIGAVTTLAGSDSPFWIRASGPVFHGATALILAAMTARLFGGSLAVWVAASYVTLPMVAVGSLLISTDTIMAPFYALALWAHLRLTESRSPGFALLAGGAAGMAFLAKYAAAYFLLGVGLGALLLPALRIGWRNAAVMLAAFGLVVLPNIVWNLRNGLATVSHTMDNVGWLDGRQPLENLDPARMVEFVLSQFAVFGPVLFAGLIWATIRPGGTGRLLVFSVPAVLVVSGQALLDRAYANWAASAYFSGTVAAVARLAARPRLLVLSLVVNGAICLVLPILTLMPGLTFGRDEPLLARYIGQADLSRQIIAQAEFAGIPVVADRRDVLADLFYTGASSEVRVYAPRPIGRPRNHYEQTHPLPVGMRGRVFLVTDDPPSCDGRAVPPTVHLDTEGGTYAGQNLAGYIVDARCLDGWH